MHIQTAAVQTLRDHEHGAVVPPVHLASTYELDPRTDDGLYAYQRGGLEPEEEDDGEEN